MNMKKLLLLFAAVIIAIAANAEHRVYIEILGQQKSLFSTKVRVTVDFGQSTSFWRGKKGQQLVSEDGKEMAFNSMVDAMNYLGQYGWKFAQAYVVTMGQSNVYHWLLYKDINNDDELYDGLLTQDLFKASQPPTEKYTLTFVKKSKAASTWDVIKEQTAELNQEELQNLVDEWKSQTSDKYDFDVRVKKNK